MVKRDEVTEGVKEILGEEILDKASEKDVMANGVQFQGTDEVKKVVLGVSLNEDFLKEAVDSGAQYCIFHHGLDPRTHNSVYPLFSQKRLRVIFEHGLTIAGFHYALDAHPELGNNAQIIEKLGAKLGEPLFEEWGWTGTFSKAQDVEKLSKKCSDLFEHDVFAVFTGPERVSKIGVVSGAGKPYAEHLAEMEQKNVQLFISGETSESVPHKMKESEINYFAGGHYATEVFGVQALGKRIKELFGKKLAVEFIDVPNPI